MFGQINWTHGDSSEFVENSSFHDSNSTEGGMDLDSSDSGPVKLSPALLLSFTIGLALLVTIGLIGNTVVIFALLRTRAHRATTTNAYILNLSIADLLFLIFCVPFQGTVYILNDWPFGDFMCKAAHYSQYCTMYASIWILTMMSVDRYLAIGHPLKSVDWRSPGQAMRICAIVWIAAAILSIPWWILYKTEQYPYRGSIVTACFDNWGRNMYEYRKWLFLIVFLTGFILPSVIIFCMSILVARSIKNAVEQPLLTVNERRNSSTGPSSTVRPTNPGINGGVISKRRRRVVWLVFGLALTFFLCWLPQNASFMWLNFYKDIAASMHRHYKIYFIIKVASHMLTYVNSSINPILYSLASGRFRSRLAHALFMRGSSTFNNRATVSRARSNLLSNTRVSKSGVGCGDSSRSTASGRVNGKSGRSLIYASTSNYSRTEDFDTNSICGGYHRDRTASPRPTTNRLVVPGSASPQTPDSPRHWSPSPTNQRELSCIANLSIDDSNSLTTSAAAARQRALTWTTTSTTLNSSSLIQRSSFDNDSCYGDAQKNKSEEKEKENLVKNPPKRRFFQFSKRY